MQTQVVRTYRGYKLDPFQAKAIEAIEKEQSVLVSAPTGTGKTLIADYVIERCFHADQRVIYTAPIKALSNQKYKEFKRLLGDEHVGILTGDVVENPEAPILIMTTEIFRNLLHQSPARLDGVHYVIFDEIHYIDDPMRGSVWEESLIFMPPHMRFLGLSATIPNVTELAQWISSVQGHEVQVVRHFERAVPLHHSLFSVNYGFCDLAKMVGRYNRYARKFGTTASGNLSHEFPQTTHLDLIKELPPEYLPCLFFAFSRRRCEAHAHQLAEVRDFLSPNQKRRVKEVINEQLERHRSSGGSLRDLEQLLLCGIGYHHAGLLPIVKDIVEELFEQKLIYVLYCTETFAVGLNFPCKTVCFDAVTKWDGTVFRPLTNREYFQIAGRAGRRGIDEVGYVFTVVDMNYFNPNEFPSMRESDVEPLQSRFTLSYNTVLNLVHNYTEEETIDILHKNFASYQTTATRRRLQAEIVRIEKELAADWCQDMGKESCPLRYLKKKRQHGALAKRMQKRLRNGDYRGIKSLRRQMRRLEKEMSAISTRKCSDECMALCRERDRTFNRLTSQLAEARGQLQELSPADFYIQQYRDKKALLAALDYLREDELTTRGQFAAQINGQELMITELFFRGVFHDWAESELAALCVSLDYEPRKGETRARQRVFDEGPVRRVMNLLETMEETYLGYTTVHLNVHMAEASFKWSEGARFNELLQGLLVDEGDIVYAFRRAIDILRQVRNAAKEDPFLQAKLRSCIERIDRDEVSILL
ncbi:MAG: DEAD/DEAH box helicase [Limnochordia bacterium]|jgi:superfamily II RNA helicase